MEVVFLGTSFFSATNNLGCPFSFSFNALNLSSMEVLRHFYSTVLNTEYCIHLINLKTFEFSRHSNVPDIRIFQMSGKTFVS